ncbi:MAG: zinc-dependent alcohol dehydrogenase [Chloroflexota bacterium]
MRAAVFKQAGLVQVEEVPTPRARPCEVVIKVTYCAICGSDLHKYAHGMMAPGVIMGHEVSGTIAEVGEGVAGWAVGDRVIRAYAGPLPPRYTSRDKGFTRDVLRPGGFSEYMTWPATGLLRIPDGLTDKVACLTEPLTIAVHAIRLSHLKLGDAVVVLGAGPIGLMAMQGLRASGPRLLVVSEPQLARREMALRLGADIALDPAETDVVAEVVNLTGGLGPNVVFECAGAKPTLQQALTMVRQRGTVVLVALSLNPVVVEPLDWVGREVCLQCSYAADATDWQVSLAALANGTVQGQPLISRVMKLDEIQTAFQDSLRPGGPLQILIEP